MKILFVLAKKLERRSISSLLLREVRLNWSFINRDIQAIVLPGMLFTTTALFSWPYQWVKWIPTLVASLLYFWLLLTCFCTSNQLKGLEEDRINKPDRPIPSGLVSASGTLQRFYISAWLSILVSVCLEVWVFTTLSLVCIYAHNFLGWGHHWFSKNLLVATGMFTTLGAAWQLVAPIPSTVWSWLFFLSSIWLFLGHIQDFRDIDGDRKVGRITFPILFGENFSRLLLGICFLLLPIPIHFILVQPSTTTVLNGWNVMFAIISGTIAIRLIRFQTPEQDDRTYSIFVKFYCLMIASSFGLLVGVG